MRSVAIITLSFVVGVGAVPMHLHAWAGPTANPPNGNVAAPLNVGSVSQVKSGSIGMNGLAVFGNSILQANSYLNWGATSGSSGYGIRDNAGALEFKNSGSSWQTIQAIVSNLMSASGQWTSGTGGAIYFNSGNVGIGTSNPATSLDIAATDTSQATVRVTNKSSTDARWPGFDVINYGAEHGGAPSIAFFSAQGSQSAPAAVAAGDNIGLMAGYGWNGSAFSENTGASAAIAFEASEAFSSTSTPGLIRFLTTPSGSASFIQNMVIEANGNVGIASGAVNPETKLDVVGTTEAIYARATAGGAYTFIGNSGTYGRIGAYTGSAWQNLILAEGGSVGIGTTNPSHKLDVNGDIQSTGEVIAHMAGGDYSQFRAVGGTTGFLIRNDGNYTYMLLTNSGSQYGAYNALRPFFIYNSSGNVGIANNAIFAQHGGNVGIGTAAPAYKLDVNGSIRYVGAPVQVSDARLKKDVRTIRGLDLITRLRGVTFNWKRDGSPSAGVIAQEVEKIMPYAVSTDDKGIKSVAYEELIAPLIESVKEQQRQIEAQQRQNEMQQDQIAVLQRRVAELEDTRHQ